MKKILFKAICRFSQQSTTFTKIQEPFARNHPRKQGSQATHQYQSDCGVSQMNSNQLINYLRTWDGDEFYTVVECLKQLDGFDQQKHYKFAVKSLWRAQCTGAIENLSLVRLIAEFYDCESEEHCHGFWLAQLNEGEGWLKNFWILQSCWLLKTRDMNFDQLSKVVRFIRHFTTQHDLLVEQIMKQLVVVVRPHQRGEALMLINQLKPQLEHLMQLKQQLKQEWETALFVPGQRIPYQYWPYLNADALSTQMSQVQDIESMEEGEQLTMALREMPYQQYREHLPLICKLLSRWEGHPLTVILGSLRDEEVDCSQWLQHNDRHLEWLEVHFVSLLSGASQQAYQDVIIQFMERRTPPTLDDLLSASRMYSISKPTIQALISNYVKGYKYLL